MSRKKRQLERVFKVFCEGETEYNYFEYIRKNKKISLAIKPVNMKGGGYSNFLTQIKEDSNTNCLAKFIVIDGDRALNQNGEDRKLKEIIDYCLIQNTSERTPHILIINFPDFEYVACLHRDSYKGKDVGQYIKKELHYGSIEDFKSDENVFNVLTKSGGSIQQLLNKINKNTKVITNDFIVNKSKFTIKVDMLFTPGNLGKKSTNFDDFYYILNKLDITY